MNETITINMPADIVRPSAIELLRQIAMLDVNAAEMDSEELMNYHNGLEILFELIKATESR